MINQAGPQPQPDPWTISGPAVYYAHAMVIGSPPGGPKGDGTLNAEAFYVAGKLYDPTVFLPLDGTVPMSGLLTLSGDPTAPTHAANKRYVDAHIAAIPPTLVTSDTPPASPYPGQLWWASLVGQLFVYYQDANSSQWVVCNNALNSISLDMGTY
jgi:hypothetical protein